MCTIHTLYYHTSLPHLSNTVLGADYSPATPSTLLFNSGSVFNGDIVCTTINITDDDIYEESQRFVVSLIAVSPPSLIAIGSGGNTYTIRDNAGYLSHYYFE